MTAAQRVEGALTCGPMAGLTDAELEALAAVRRGELQAIEDEVRAQVQDVQRDLAAIEAEQHRRQDIKRLKQRLADLESGKVDDPAEKLQGLTSALAAQVHKDLLRRTYEGNGSGYIQPLIVPPPGAGIGGPR